MIKNNPYLCRSLTGFKFNGDDKAPWSVLKVGLESPMLDLICHDYIVNVQGAIPANVAYLGYSKTILTSVNQAMTMEIRASRYATIGKAVRTLCKDSGCSTESNLAIK